MTSGCLTLGHRVAAAAMRGPVGMKVRVGGTQRQTSWLSAILPGMPCVRDRIARQRGVGRDGILTGGQGDRI
jgi:hypothetical protein